MDLTRRFQIDLHIYNTLLRRARDAYAREHHCRCGALTRPDVTLRGVRCQLCKEGR